MGSDILQEIPHGELDSLLDFYQQHLPYATHIYGHIKTALKWKERKPDGKHITFYAPNGDWRPDGTFVALMQFSCYDIMLFTMDKTYERLYKSLTETKRIDWKRHVMYFALHKDMRDTVFRAMKDINVPIVYDFKCHYWWLPHEKAAAFTFECPDEYYIAKLTKEHAAQINDYWPHRYKDSVRYVETLIEMNGTGHGVFTKSDNKLVCWVLKMQMGQLGLVTTVEEHQRKGLAALVMKSLSKEVGLEGISPVGTVLLHNTASRNMFLKLGFEVLDWCSFTGFGAENGHVNAQFI